MKTECPIPIVAQTAAFESRMISRLPSPEMWAVAAVEPGIYEEARGGRCYRTPLNFIGALLVHQYPKEFGSVFESHGIAVPEIVKNPIEILPDVPLVYFDDETGTYQPLALTAPRVLIKYASGFTSGIVAQGPLTGLLVERLRDQADLSRMYVGRVFNDSTEPHEVPYTPLDYTDHDLSDMPNALRMVKADCFDVMQRAFLRSVTELGRSNYSASSLFLSLCDRAGVQFDIDAFHFTRPAPQP